MYEIKTASPNDVQALHALILDAAEECGARDQVSTTPERLLADGFGTHPHYQSLLAWNEGEPVGFALFFQMYSSWKGKRTLYLEDLYVRPMWRRHGIGLSLFAEVERMCLHADANLAWECERDEMRLRHFFLGMGAVDRSHKVSYYMERDEMRQHLQIG